MKIIILQLYCSHNPFLSICYHLKLLKSQTAISKLPENTKKGWFALSIERADGQLVCLHGGTKTDHKIEWTLI